jgi:hypothetical protein
MYRAGSEGFTGVFAQRKETRCCLELAWKLALTAGVLKCIVRARRPGWTGSLRYSFSTLRDATGVCASTTASFSFPHLSFRFSPKSKKQKISNPTSGSALLKLISLAERFCASRNLPSRGSQKPLVRRTNQKSTHLHTEGGSGIISFPSPFPRLTGLYAGK